MASGTRKVTLVLPRDLLERAQKASRAGVTETVRAGLRVLAAAEVYDQLLQKRGKVRLARTWRELKDDR